MNRFVAVGAVLLLTLFAAVHQVSAQAVLNPFVGYWKGSAPGEVMAGKQETLTCTTNNSMRDGGLRMVLRCANASNLSLQIYASITEKALPFPAPGKSVRTTCLDP